jgi:hypothetical protein
MLIKRTKGVRRSFPITNLESGLSDLTRRGFNDRTSNAILLEQWNYEIEKVLDLLADMPSQVNHGNGFRCSQIRDFDDDNLEALFATQRPPNHRPNYYKAPGGLQYHAASLRVGVHSRLQPIVLGVPGSVQGVPRTAFGAAGAWEATVEISATAGRGSRNRDRAELAAKLQSAAALNDQHVVRSRKMSISMRIGLIFLNIVHVNVRNSTTLATAWMTTTPFSTPMPSTTTPTQNASSSEAIEVPSNFVVIFFSSIAVCAIVIGACCCCMWYICCRERSVKVMTHVHPEHSKKLDIRVTAESIGRSHDRAELAAKLEKAAALNNQKVVLQTAEATDEPYFLDGPEVRVGLDY